jgi:enamine deaminase RidA (YjgF/YER057c/UK114 family)
MQQLLAAHGATLENVVSETHYVTNWDEFFKGAAVRIKAYDDAGAAYPTSVAFEANSLAESGLVVEVQAVAYLGD